VQTCCRRAAIMARPSLAVAAHDSCAVDVCAARQLPASCAAAPCQCSPHTTNGCHNVGVLTPNFHDRAALPHA